MTGSKNAFGTTSRFGQLSYPRKVGIGAVALLLGFAIADPGFLSGDSFNGTYEINENDDVDSLLAKMNDKKSPDDDSSNQSSFTVADNTEAAPSLTIPSLAAPAASMQNVSYPASMDSDTGAAFAGAGSHSVATTEIHIPDYSSGSHSGGGTSGSAPVSIRFMGTIYPAN